MRGACRVDAPALYDDAQRRGQNEARRHTREQSAALCPQFAALYHDMPRVTISGSAAPITYKLIQVLELLDDHVPSSMVHLKGRIGTQLDAKPARIPASEIQHNPDHSGLPCDSHDLGAKRKLVVRLSLESDREGQALLHILHATHSAPKVGLLAVHVVEDIHHRPDDWLDIVTRPVLPRGHVGRPGKRGPATGSAPAATNSRAPTDTHQPGRLPGVTAPPRRRPTDNLADASRVPGRRAAQTWLTLHAAPG